MKWYKWKRTIKLLCPLQWSWWAADHSVIRCDPDTASWLDRWKFRRNGLRSREVCCCCFRLQMQWIVNRSCAVIWTVLIDEIWGCSVDIWVMVIVWRLRGNIIRTALCWVVWHNVHSQQHTHMSRSYRSSRLGLSHWDPYAMHRGRCLELYYCNMVEWCWWDSSLIWKTNWFPSVLWHCWFGHRTCKIVPEMTYNVSSGTLSLYTTYHR